MNRSLALIATLLIAAPAFAQWPSSPSTAPKQPETTTPPPAQAPPPPPRRTARVDTPRGDDGSGFGLGVRAAWAFPMGGLTSSETLGDTVNGAMPLWVEAGYHFNRNLYAGLDFQYAPGFTNCLGGQTCSSTGMRFGLEVLYHFVADGLIQPWAGIGGGYELLNTSKSGDERNFKGLELLNLQLGVDFAVTKTFLIRAVRELPAARQVHLVQLGRGLERHHRLDRPQLAAGRSEGRLQAVKHRQVTTGSAMLLRAWRSPLRILVVDDDAASRLLMEQILAEDGHRVTAVSDGAEAIRHLEKEAELDAVVSDIRMVDVDGLEVLDWVHKHLPETPVLLVTAFGNVDGAVDAIRRGAYDYISKPYDVNAIKLVVDRALRHRRLSAENRRLKREIREKYSLQNVIGRSEGMLQVYKTAARVALTDATVLVIGESGTGKELVARAIHTASGRSAGPFIAVDCGAIAEGVLESELFGHARGSFTGATGRAARHVRGGRRRHALPRRDRRHRRPHPGPAPARLAGGRDPAGRRVVGGARRHPRRHRHQQEPRRAGEAGEVPRGPLLPAQCGHHPDSAPARAARGHPAAAPSTSRRGTRVSGARRSPPRRARRCSSGTGPATSASWRTRSRARWPCNPGGTILPEDLPDAVRERWQEQRGVSKPPSSLTPPPVATAPDPILADQPTLDELNRRYAERILREKEGNKTKAAEALGIDRKTLSRLLREE